MLIGRVIDDKIHYNAQTSLVSTVKHRLKVLHRAVFRLNGAVIRNVIAVVLLRGLVERRKPYGVNAEALYVIKLRQHALKVADAVPVAVAEAARPNLVD